MVAVLIVFVFAAQSVFAGAIEDVRDAEIAFAKAFANRDEAKFFSFVLNDSTFFNARTLHGKQEVVERWSRFFKAPQAPFSWTPERVAVNAAGTIGLSSGPVVDPKGQLVGTYASVWVKQPDGAWKILFDGPGGAAACLPETAAPVKEGDIALAGGGSVHYKVIGDGPAKVVIPGGLPLANDFKGLGDLATMVFYDVREHADGKSDLEAVREFFKFDKFVPLGYAKDSRIAALYANHHPEHVSRFIALSPLAAGEPVSLAVPVLILRGTNDATAWAKSLPDARLLSADDAANVFGAIRQFLRGEWPLLAEKAK
jgi:ketosteroid isomerase-like protein